MTKATPQVIVAPSAKPVIMKMVAPGRRALGEDWNETTVSWNEETGRYDVDIEATERPADGQAIFVPGMGNESMEVIDYLIGWQKKQAEYRAANPARPRYESMAAEINAAWQDYVAEKLKWMRRESTFGPGGHTQRGDL